MLIIKKSGKLEDFDIDKILRAIENAANDINISLNYSDIKLIKRDINSKILKIRKNNKTISTYEIKGIVIEVLVELGFKKIAIEYLNLDK